MSTHGSNLIVHREDDALVVAFCRADLIDTGYLMEVEEEIHGLVEKRDEPIVVVDFGGVRYLTSRALSLLVNVHFELERRGGSLRIANVAPEVACVFDVARMRRLLTIYDSVVAAVRGE